VIPIPYQDHIVDVPLLQSAPTVAAFRSAATSYEPVLAFTDAIFHKLVIANKMVVRLLFQDSQEVETLMRLKPFVELSRNVVPGVKYDFLEVYRSGVLWLVDPDNLIWVSDTETYIKESRQPKLSEGSSDEGERDIPWWNR